MRKIIFVPISTYLTVDLVSFIKDYSDSQRQSPEYLSSLWEMTHGKAQSPEPMGLDTGTKPMWNAME